jgi:hypothetical protein
VTGRHGFLLAALTISAAYLMAGWCQAQAGTLYLDIGNDTDYEWSAPVTFTGPATLEVTGSMNHYVRGGCWCIGCVMDAISGNCTVPVVVKADNPGTLTVNDVKFTYERAQTLGEVTFGDSFRSSKGACWDVTFLKSGTVRKTIPVPPSYNLGNCATAPKTLNFNSANPCNAPLTDDAIDDAAYRLFKSMENAACTVKADYNGNISVQADGEIGVQTMWGPVGMRLIVWS